MDSEVFADVGTARRHRRLCTEIKDSLRELGIQLALLNHQVVAHLDLNDGDLHCLNITARYGPLSPSALARRAVTVRVLRDRTAELLRLYSGMSTSMDEVCTRYTDTELELLSDFLRRTTDAGEH